MPLQALRRTEAMSTVSCAVRGYGHMDSGSPDQKKARGGELEPVQTDLSDVSTNPGHKQLCEAGGPDAVPL